MNAPGYAALNERQRGVAERVLKEEGRVRRHLVVYLSGAHAYGFPSPTAISTSRRFTSNLPAAS